MKLGKPQGAFSVTVDGPPKTDFMRLIEAIDGVRYAIERQTIVYQQVMERFSDEPEPDA